ncbi:MAG: hypothetical protein JXE07_05595 [Candidatus Aminicenantes bacterium]|nr:hypothetical protein [Candidatus Aminicenantes bacterium]
MSRIHDLCLAWNWEYDADFVKLLGEACSSRGLDLWEATPETLCHVLEDLHQGTASFKVLLDRASDADPRFLSLVKWAEANAVRQINPHAKAVHAINKASMHLEFITAGIQTPHTIILPPYNECPQIVAPDTGPLGDRFVVKPAHGGGGEGVVFEVSSIEQVLTARRAFSGDHYLLQARITPAEWAGRRAWFRVIYCDGKVYRFWWDITRPVYRQISEEEDREFGLAPLTQIMLTIAGICGLDLFSTEIALTAAGVFVVVDYVNNPIDLRLRSAAADGVPDETVRDIAGRLADLVLRNVDGASP